MSYRDMSKEQLLVMQKELQRQYEEFAAMDLQLNMTRGKPNKRQLDLTDDLFSSVDSKRDAIDSDGIDCRNYGELFGIRGIRELMAPLVGADPDHVIAGGSSSLNMMYDTIMRAVVFGSDSNAKPWGTGKQVKFLCPSPGYDRHFGILEVLDFDMIRIDMDDNGPNMDQVEQIVSKDASVKGMWCVPVYSNPTGCCYSQQVIDRLASMKTAASDFRIFCDNAYPVHFLYEPRKEVMNLLEACAKAGNPDRAYVFSSTSKISYAGAGIGVMGTSQANIKHLEKSLSKQTIGPDKMNQLLHVRAFKNYEGILAHMQRHADILRPKFEMVQKTLHDHLAGTDIAKWTQPKGGYFLSFDTMDECAKKTVAYAKRVGVEFTNAGATYPYGIDPRDRNIRIAPTMPDEKELEIGISVLCVCSKMSGIEKLLQERG